MEQKYIEFFLNSKVNVVGVETIELSHPSFSQVFYLVRNSIKGFTATDENSIVKTYQYVPMTINSSEVKDNMDNSIEINLGDVGTIIPEQLELVRLANTYDIEPDLVYRLYRSDDTTAPMLIAPLKVSDIVFNKSGCKITAKAERFNVNKTGERYTLARFPMLRGVL